jgi:hypothetical protein
MNAPSVQLLKGSKESNAKNASRGRLGLRGYGEGASATFVRSD